jgi:hypothetical protein
MTADGDSVTKRAAPPVPVYLSEDMKIARAVQVLEQLTFDSRQQGKIVVDRVARNFLLHAARAAAADPEQTVHEALRQHGPVRR